MIDRILRIFFPAILCRVLLDAFSQVYRVCSHQALLVSTKRKIRAPQDFALTDKDTNTAHGHDPQLSDALHSMIVATFIDI
jgi:hypothetical protein